MGYQPSKKKCGVSPFCIELMTRKGLTGYGITHQMLWTMLSEQVLYKIFKLKYYMLLYKCCWGTYNFCFKLKCTREMRACEQSIVKLKQKASPDQNKTVIF